MKSINLLLFSFLCISAYLNGQENREVTILKDHWKFTKGTHNGAIQPDFNDSDWQSISLPHDWAISGPFIKGGDGPTGKLPWKDEGWYRNKIHVPQHYKGKQVYLLFDGIMAFPKVYFNGAFVGEWDYGYNSFYLDITDFIIPGSENTLTIQVDTRKHDSRWYPGAGIYRKISMIAVNPVHVDIWGTYVTTPIIKPSYAGCTYHDSGSQRFRCRRKNSNSTNNIQPGR